MSEIYGIGGDLGIARTQSWAERQPVTASLPFRRLKRRVEKQTLNLS